MLNREQYLSVDHVEIETVENVPFWGDVFIRSMTAGQRDAIESAHSQKPFLNFRAMFVQASMCDEDGNLIFTKQDLPALSAMSAKIVETVFSAVAKLNKISKEDVEGMEKNSEGVPPEE